MTTNEGQPLVSIGITCYNAADTIARAIESAFAQEWGNLEILIVDDCSGDGSVAVIQSCIQDRENAVLIQHPINQGPAAARQSILDHSRGEFIVFFDDDDQSLPQRVVTQYERIVSYECDMGVNLAACYASGQRIYPNGYRLDMAAIGSQAVVPHGSLVADRLLFFGDTPDFFFGGGTPTCSLMARRFVFEEVGGFDPAFRRVEDVDFAVRLALAGGHFIGCPESLFIQYASEGGDKSPEKNKDAEQGLAEKHKEYLRSQGRYFYAKTWPLLRYHHFKGQYFKMLCVLSMLFIRHPFKTSRHFLRTAPRRFLHERKMKDQNIS